MKRRDFLTTAAIGGAAAAIGLPKQTIAQSNTHINTTSNANTTDDHSYFSGLLQKIAEPVLYLIANEKLHKEFPLQVSPNADNRNKKVAYLECFARMISGTAPWLGLDSDGADKAARTKLKEYALQAYEHSVNPNSADYLNWEIGEGQLLVDSAYYTQALLRAPELWHNQTKTTQKRIIEKIKMLRKVTPPYTNWLLFAAINEAFLLKIGEEHDPIRLDLTIRKFLEWYLGDGWFGDGEQFAFDYYNSYVIHPMLLDILKVMADKEVYFWHGDSKKLYQQQLKRSQRFCEHLERLISPTGTYPPIGRSLTYRTTAFQPLSQLALNKQLPDSLAEGTVRGALRAVHQAIFTDPSNFKDGFLQIGFARADASLGDWYSNNGSMYITTNSFLHLGLPATDSFWTAPAQDWTQKLAFGGHSFKKDYPVEY
ncbi:DUF2264 domain-containing protein [Catenovulum sp. 2E275]|uniref:DUF2264 domain-containing protein n=1 Tax=Catenovulum sp. 2E275 TaxID=2980497 RepID=UPI0021D16B96|nr:DUF2264 domain-containing protein [Catenovulum sp. 2E275]MCU4675916.1 DUF2264 domain-containing protein [Catenovulum sp. 2E275]